jgi:hypothetical protein
MSQAPLRELRDQEDENKRKVGLYLTAMLVGVLTSADLTAGPVPH